MTTPYPKTPLRPVIRVFVSSTLSDMKHERNALQEHVFPKLEQFCLRSGFQFQAIDLRWGVSSEAGLDHRAMQICLEELRRAQEVSPRPNFLILLGSRYGWRPLPEVISIEEFNMLEKVAAQMAPAIGRSAVSVLRDWYVKDENAKPPVYLLQSRRQRLSAGKDYSQDEPWHHIQSVLWAIINNAIPPKWMQERFRIPEFADGSPPSVFRFHASATEQEIWHGALRVADAHEHVFAFLRDIENISEFSAPPLIGNFVDLTASGEIDVAQQAEQNRLKKLLCGRLGKANILEMTSARLTQTRDREGRPAVDIVPDYLPRFCVEVESRLKEIIQGQIEEYWGKTIEASTERKQRELEIERDEHDRISLERGSRDLFVGRQTELDQISEYVGSASRWPLVVYGSSGCGKTALLARASQEVSSDLKVIVRFIGTTPRTSDVRSLLVSLCQEVQALHPSEHELPAEAHALIEELHRQFQSATREQPLILFLDALDQLSDADNGRQLNWIPVQLPAYVKIVVSCLSDRAPGDPAGQPFSEFKRRRLPIENFVDLGALSQREAYDLVFERWLPRSARIVSSAQRICIERRLASAACRQPLYLKLLYEQVRQWRSYEVPPELGEDVPALLAQFIDRLSLPTNHGQLLVHRVLGYLVTSRRGLTESEILEILFADPDYKAELSRAGERTQQEMPPNATRIPIAIWSRLRFDLAPYLTERAALGANVLTFYHRQVGQWVSENYSKALDKSWQPHRQFAKYFRRKADPLENTTWRAGNPRALGELPYHLACAGYDTELRELFRSLPYLAARIATGQVFEQIADYAFAGPPMDSDLLKWRAFLQKHAQRLAQRPTMLVALVNHEGFTEAQVQIANIAWSEPWLRTSREERPARAVTSRDELTLRVVRDLQFSWNGVAAIAPLKAIAFRLERLGTLGVFDLNTMQKTQASLSIRRDRPLVIACSPDASSIAIFYDTSVAALYRCVLDQDGRPASAELWGEFRFLLPNEDDPVVVWHAGSFWYQATTGSLASVSVERSGPLEEGLPPDQHGELSALAFAGSTRLIALRQGDGSTIGVSGVSSILRRVAQVTAACACGEKTMAVAFTDGSLIVFECGDKMRAIAEVFAGSVLGSLGWDGSRLMWRGQTSGFMVWCPSDAAPRRVQDDQEVFRADLLVIPRRWILQPDGSMLLGTTHNLVVFRLLTGGATADGGLEQILGGAAWRAVVKRDDGPWLLERKAKRETSLGLGKLGRLACAVDGKGRFFALTGSGPGLAMNPWTFQSTPLRDCPPGVSVAVGEDGGGCWFTDRRGDIYFADTTGRCIHAASVDLNQVSGSQIENCGSHLLWTGYSSKVFPEIDFEESARTFVFFHKARGSPPTLERMAEQFRNPREESCISLCYDRASERLVTLWGNHARYYLRIGRIEEFAQWRFREIDVPGLEGFGFEQANLSANGAFLAVINARGEVSYVSIADGHVVATLAGSVRFTAIVSGAGDSQCWLVEAGTSIYSCELIGGRT